MNTNKSDSSFVSKILRNSVLILLLIIFISIVYNFRNRPEETAVALMSDAVASKELSGVFIRNEEVRYCSGNGIISYNVADGGKLGNGTVIAEIYPDDTQIGRNREIEKLTRELDILKKIQNPGTIESAQPSTLSASIEESYRSLIYSRDTGDYETLKKNMEDLVVDMSTYQIITKQVSGFNQQITDINAELALLKSESTKPTETITSPRSAYFISYCDGYEDELTPDKLDKLTISELNSIVDRKSDDKQIVGKLIDGFGWYLAGVIDNSRKEYAIGGNVKLRFDSSAETFDAVIKDVRDEGSAARSIIILECDQFNYDLVKHRVEKCEIIKGEYRGLKVPRESIRFADVTETASSSEEDGAEPADTTVNYKGVYIMKGEQITFKKIDVIFEGSDYVLSEVHEDDPSYLSLYDDILIEGADTDD
ncbi:MAG: hypothetical protein MJ079_00405 [Ruminococcus sp.]|nr:hypothetical protein [Ruminococcus sp.]